MTTFPPTYRDSSPPRLSPTTTTLVEVIYSSTRGRIGLRGSHAPLSWEHTEPPTEIDGDRHLFRIPVADGDVLELRVVRDDACAVGRNYVLHAGDHLRIEAYFDEPGPVFEAGSCVSVAGDVLPYDVLLPPSYVEQEDKRYPVLYVLDGQLLWSHSKDAEAGDGQGTWELEKALAALYDLGAIEEVIVVGVHTSQGRIDKLSPVADPEHGGGGGAAFLRTLTDVLRPQIDARYRTLTGPRSTAILGASLGGLFAFFAGWTRPDVFGKAACLSSSFWWADRWAIRLVQGNGDLSSRTMFYLDSGAVPRPLARDIDVQNGFHQTRSMFRALARSGFALGSDMHRLVFPGTLHQAACWSSRIAVPLQLLFPPEMQQAAPQRPAPRAPPLASTRPPSVRPPSLAGDLGRIVTRFDQPA